MSELPAGASPHLGGDDVNDRVKRNQMILWFSIIVAMAIPLSILGYTQVFPSGAKSSAADVARHNSATAAVASSVNQISPIDDLASKARESEAALAAAQQKNVELQQKLAQSEAQQQADRADATHTLKVMSQNMGMHPTPTAPTPVGGSAGVLGNGAESAQALAPLPSSGVSARGPARKGLLTDLGASAASDALTDPAVPHRSMQLVTASAPAAAIGGQAGGVPAGPNEAGKSATAPVGGKGSFFTSKFETFESSKFVPPNAYVEAKVLVGVDAATGTSYGADPKPVLFRLLGPATHVGIDGKFQTTDLTGCLVNGAAFGELPSEKVYIKLQKITCPAAAGSFSVATVEGYVSSKGKAGVRGNVISREGQFTGRAMIAGLLNGLGAGLSKNVQASQGGLTTGISGTGDLTAHQLSAGQIATGSVGAGVSQAASMLADYYIKRAEQYQPVIEMPTGIQVELVFLSGFQVK